MRLSNRSLKKRVNRKFWVRISSLGALALAAAVLLTGCGGGAISSLDDAKAGVIRIEATGTFHTFEGGEQANSGGTGTGFIIDPSGIAVTNHHVVGGAATLAVQVGGSTESVNARILGVSECADLAVIDLDGEGYSYFDWYTGEIDVNLDVRSAGYPLSTMEYTMTRGIVSKARANGETPWASIDAVIEHDARINPGNSGGPLLAEDGHVVGVNYAVNIFDGQNFAIAAPMARAIVDELAAGTAVQSIGINGQAVATEEDGPLGIWVTSVVSGSPASNAGIEAGDLMTRLEDLVLANPSGTMETYCDVLQSRGVDAVMKVEVFRPGTGEVLEGEINGRQLEPTFSFAQAYGGDVAAESAAGGYAGDGYVQVSDDSGMLTFQVPASWAQINGMSTDQGDPALSASPDQQGWQETWDVPGVLFIASAQYNAQSDESVLDLYSGDGECISQGRSPYEDQLYAGTMEFFANCGGTDTARALVVARPADGSYAAIIDMQFVSEADLQALDQVMRTFQVNVGG
jgi:serine protease Do